MIRSMLRLTCVAAFVGAAVLVPATASQAAGGAEVTVVHGIGPAPKAVDVYVGGTDATEWDLVPALAGLEFGDSVNLGSLPAGGHNLLICTASTMPATTITSCTDNGASGVNGNPGTNVTLADGVPEMWVAAYGDPAFGRPTVLEFNPDLSCVDGASTARVTAVHAATAPPVKVLVDGTTVIPSLSYGTAATPLDVPTGSYDVAVELLDNSAVLSVPGFTPAAKTNTAVIVVGNPQFDAAFSVVTTTFPLSVCAVATTTSTPPTTSKPPVAVTQPKFTG